MFFLIIKLFCIKITTINSTLLNSVFIKFFLIIIFVSSQLFVFSNDFIKPDTSLLKRIKNLELSYTQYKDGETFISNVSIMKSVYAEEEIIISKTTSPDDETLVYLKLNGELIKTKIYDKKEKTRYLIEYDSGIRVKKISENDRSESYFNENAIDVSALSLLLGLNKPEINQTYDINIIDYRNGELKKVKLEVIETDYKVLFEEMEINTVKYNISSFLFYDSVFYYSLDNFPVLIYYEGPESINLFKRTKVRIQKESYLKGKALF